MRRVVVNGYTTQGFESLADVFGRLGSTQPAGGAALCVYQNGKCVADLSFGDYSTSSRQVVFSVSKLLIAIAIHRVAERGSLNLETQLAKAWPDFGSAGGANILIRDVMAHRTSLAALNIAITAEDVLNGGDRRAVLNAAPGAHRTESHGYHAVTYGTILEAVIEESLGISVSQLLRDEIAAPLGADVNLGAGVSDVHPLLFSEPAEVLIPGLPAQRRDGLLAALVNDPELFNSAAFLTAGLASMGVVTTAAALAQVMASTVGDVGGVRLLAPTTLDGMIQVRSAGVDKVLGVSTSFGSGPQLAFPRLPIGSRAFGHEGAGGSVAFADPGLALGVGFSTDLFPSAPGASPLFLGLLPTLKQVARANIEGS
ncbi:serine hydrolase domain-containing protein [Pseudarthrobacter phenanthrenivorans]|uniref:serine hydrolase domain-containing protein n=1 Tax=Pseudarthrobacter phenanthrenivorans TaxID=361575 RepID=UPI002F355D6F